MKKLANYAAFCAFIAGLGHAPALAGPAWSAPLTLTTYMAQDERLVFIASGSTNPLGCSNSTWFYIYQTDPGYQLVASTLLSAFLQGRRVIVYEASCDPDPVGGVRFRGARLDN